MMDMSSPAEVRIVTICGSTRFREEMARANRELTLAGFLVFAPGVFGQDGDQVTEDEKADLDILHLQKIDLSEMIYVVNPGGYIGDSTRREIVYARANNKTIVYMAQPDTGEEKS